MKLKKDVAKTDADFHVALAMASHNTLLSHLMATWYDLIWKTQRMARQKIFRRQGNSQTIADQHLSLFNAIKAGDKDKASRIARDHTDFVAEELRHVLTEEQAS